MTSKLKLAFFNFCRKNVFEAQTLLEDLFSAPSSKNEVDSLMDRMVIELSQKIIDDYPASDPRWTDSVPAGHESTFTTVSLLVLHQLEDKVKAHDLFLTFLRLASTPAILLFTIFFIFRISTISRILASIQHPASF